MKSWGWNRVCPRGEVQVWRGVISNLDGIGWRGYDACNKLKCFSNNRHKMRACKSLMLILDSEVAHGCSTRIYQSMPNSNVPICCALSTQCPLSLLDFKSFWNCFTCHWNVLHKTQKQSVLSLSVDSYLLAIMFSWALLIKKDKEISPVKILIKEDVTQVGCVLN